MDSEKQHEGNGNVETPLSAEPDLSVHSRINPVCLCIRHLDLSIASSGFYTTKKPSPPVCCVSLWCVWTEVVNSRDQILYPITCVFLLIPDK